MLAHGRDILWFCRMTAGNAHEGDELYQDTMLTLLEHLDRLDEKNNSKSYALSVAIRLWKNRRRKFAWRMRIAPQESYEVHIQNGGEASETRNADPEVQVLQEETGEDKYRPHPLLKKMVRGGLLGKKSGAGFYTY